MLAIKNQIKCRFCLLFSEGRQPLRSGVHGAMQVFLPQASTGLPLEEIILAERLREAGYKTGMVGKWHLGKICMGVAHACLPRRNVAKPFSYNVYNCNGKALHGSQFGSSSEFCSASSMQVSVVRFTRSVSIPRLCSACMHGFCVAV